MNPSLQRDIGAYVTGENAFNTNTLNSNSTTENAIEQNGIAVDRLGFNDLLLSAKVMIPYSYSLAAAHTLTVVSNVQDADSSTGTWADYANNDGTTSSSVTLGSTGSTAAQTGNGVFEYSVDLSGAKEFVRIQLTGTFSESSTASGSDDVDIGGVWVFGGSDQPPAD